MTKPLAIFDIDRTVTPVMTFVPMVEFQSIGGLVHRSVSDKVKELHESYSLGQLGFEMYVRELLGTYALGLADRPVDEVEESTNEFFKTVGFYPWVRPTIDALALTHRNILSTSNMQFAAAAVAKICGVGEYRSSILEVVGSRLSGKVKSLVSTPQEKREAINDLFMAGPRVGSLAFGDSEGDLGNLRAAHHRVCITPTAALRVVAEILDWYIIDNPDELYADTVLPAVERQLALFHSRTTKIAGNSYFESQYVDSSKVSARFKMYTLEMCEPGQKPFNPDDKIVEALKYLSIPKNGLIVDMGTSFGHLLYLLATKGYEHLFGFDPNSSQFHQGQRKPRERQQIALERQDELSDFINPTLPEALGHLLTGATFATHSHTAKIHLVKADANNVPVKKGSVKVYLANNILYHLKDIEGALGEVLVALEPNGIFVATTSGENNKFEHREDEEEINRIIMRKTGTLSRTAPRMNEGWTTQKAREALLQYFTYVRMLNHEGILLVKDDESKELYRQSLYSMYDQYDPIPDWNMFVEAVEEIINNIPPEGKTIKLSRSIAICSNVDFDAGPEYV